MSDELLNFIATLPADIQELVIGKKNKRALEILQDNGIDVPTDILDALDARSFECRTHESDMEAMREFLGVKPSEVNYDLKIHA